MKIPVIGGNKKMSKNTPENLEKRAIKDYLNAKRYFWWYNVQGLGSFRGLPDIFALRGGKIWAIEVKAKKGKLSSYQVDFLITFKEAGGKVIVGGIDAVMKSLSAI
jgi:hypothetical protein